MTTTITVVDETVGGDTINELTLEFLNERITVRELIRSRIYQEVSEYNASLPGSSRGLVQPAEAERVLNGYRLRPARRIDWEEQYRRALRAFESNGFVILVDDRQIEDLDQEIELRHDSKVSFLKLTPLVGG